ncbi:MAG: redox-active disulfide protein 2 [Firmicutes bacterium HGW-Firmicutes-20]|jgi:small redox-active disulfide protein 2|nr:MAG: redox-active disulfide protein 2 [Firmicutes bacterium HGW-Firmicutes-20]PKM66222.1 MAG: redox-active disulfide protein 2 [Firmicutes bacterium HGW-Firmicutes-19]
MIIKILGSGCPNCKKLEINARDAVKQLGIGADFVKVTDFKEIANYGIMRTPGLVFDEKVVSFGKVTDTATIVELLKTYINDRRV